MSKSLSFIEAVTFYVVTFHVLLLRQKLDTLRVNVTFCVNCYILRRNTHIENYIFSVCVNHFLLTSFHKRRYKMKLVYLSIHILHDPVYVAVITC